MQVFRLCNKEEIENILSSRNFRNIGHACKVDSRKNTHQYVSNKKYMHFFSHETGILHMLPSKGKYICVYNIPDDILKKSEGIGHYYDFINFKSIQKIPEYAIENEEIRFNYLDKIYIIEHDLDFDYYPSSNEISSNISCIYDFALLKEKLNQLLVAKDVVKEIEENMEDLLILIPEIKHMIGFEHNHPHHHLDVWSHTLEVIRNLNTQDMELNLAGLLHDIGKPFSYQDDEVRHFHGHPEVSYKMGIQILSRLGYSEEFINRVLYLVKNHDTVIDVNNLDNNNEMIKKLLELQYADARAHHPDKIEKRIKYLDKIKKQIYEKVEGIEK